MLTREMQDFYASVGYPISRMIRKAPNGLEEWQVLRAAEEIFDRLYCYDDLIQIQRALFQLADTYEDEKDYAKEQAEIKDAQMWKERAINYRNDYRTTLFFLCLSILFTLGVLYHG